MGKVNFTREFMFEVLDCSGPYGEDHDEIEVISDTIVDTGRWSIIHELIFKYQDKYYRTDYSVGATEQQDEGPWEFKKGDIECIEVRPVEKVVTVYEDV